MQNTRLLYPLRIIASVHFGIASWIEADCISLDISCAGGLGISPIFLISWISVHGLVEFTWARDEADVGSAIEQHWR